MTNEVYLDNGATTSVDRRVLDRMLPFFDEHYGNASSLHSLGVEAKKAIEDARKIIARKINADPSEIIFTSGGTESNNFALKGIIFANKEKNHIITTKVEHKCIMNACKWLEKQGIDITYLNVDGEGFVDLKELEDSITDKTALVSIIHANNEIGTIQDLEKIGAICKKHDVPLHSDACQSFTKVPIDVKKENISLLTINAHKINGPKGVGALYIRKGIKIEPLLHGGEHEFGKRAGTENVPGIIGFAEAVNISATDEEINKMSLLRDRLIDSVLKIKGTKLNGPKGKERLCNNVHLSIYGIEGESIGGMLNQYGIMSSTGSACSEASLEPSYVLLAIGLTDEQANGSLRLTLSRYTTEEDIKKVEEVMPKIVTVLRNISPFGGEYL